MFIISICAYAKSVNRRELLSASRMIADKTRKKKDCLESRVMLGADNEDFICVEQRWANHSSMQNYFRSDLFDALIGAMKMLSESWEIKINESIRTEGMEAVEKIRKKGNK